VLRVIRKNILDKSVDMRAPGVRYEVGSNLDRRQVLLRMGPQGPGCDIEKAVAAIQCVQGWAFPEFRRISQQPTFNPRGQFQGPAFRGLLFA
jgi:hypothetical protein